MKCHTVADTANPRKVNLKEVRQRQAGAKKARLRAVCPDKAGTPRVKKRKITSKHRPLGKTHGPGRMPRPILLRPRNDRIRATVEIRQQRHSNKESRRWKNARFA